MCIRDRFKLASGLTSKTIQFNMDDFLKQVDEMQLEDDEPGQGAPKEDWFSTHPFSPLRVRALKLFDESSFMKKGGTEPVDLEVGVTGLMSLMEPSYLEGKTETAEAMRRLLFAGALVVANARDGIGEEEIALFEKFFGKGAFSDGLDLDALDRDLEERIDAVKESASTPQAMQVVRDLCMVARAEGEASDEEIEVLERVAEGLGIAKSFVCTSLDADMTPD